MVDMTAPNAPARLPDPRTQPTMDIWPQTGQLLGLSRQSTYDAANRGDIPTIRIGRRILVPTAAIHRLLQVDEPTPDRGMSPPRASGASKPDLGANQEGHHPGDYLSVPGETTSSAGR